MADNQQKKLKTQEKKRPHEDITDKIDETIKDTQVTEEEESRTEEIVTEVQQVTVKQGKDEQEKGPEDPPQAFREELQRGLRL